MGEFKQWSNPETHQRAGAKFATVDDRVVFVALLYQPYYARLGGYSAFVNNHYTTLGLTWSASLYRLTGDGGSEIVAGEFCVDLLSAVRWATAQLLAKEFPDAT